MSSVLSGKTVVEDNLPNGIDQHMIERGHARRMGHLENYFALLQRQELYSNFAISCKLNNNISFNDLRVALREILINNPILANTIIPKNYPNQDEFYRSKEYLSKPWPQHDYIKILNKLELDDIVINNQPEYSELIAEIIDEYKNSDYKITSTVSELISRICIPICEMNKPNWRLLCFPTKENDTLDMNTICYVSNHCCADGLTGINLFEDIVQVINSVENIEKDTESKLIYEYEKDGANIKKLPIPITDRVSFIPSILSFIMLLIATMVNGFFNYKTSAPLTSKINKDKFQTCYHNFIKISPKEVEEIKMKIKEQNCTMTAFLQSGLFVALSNHGIFNDRKYNEYSFDITIPNNARKLLPEELVEEQYKYGSNVGGLHYSYLISSFKQNKFWSLARYYTKVIRTADYFSGLGSIMMDFMIKKQNIDSIISESYLNKKRGGIILSNVGFFEQDPHDHLQIDDLLFIQNLGVLNFSYSANVITTTHGGMNISMSIVEGTMTSRAEFETFCDEFKKLLFKETSM